MDAAEIPDGWHKVPASLHRQQRQQQHPDHNDQQMQPCNTPSITVPRAPLSHLKLISSKPPASFWCVTHIHCRNAAEFICLKCHVIRVFPGRVERQPLWKHLFSKNLTRWIKLHEDTTQSISVPFITEENNVVIEGCPQCLVWI